MQVEAIKIVAEKFREGRATGFDAYRLRLAAENVKTIRLVQRLHTNILPAILPVVLIAVIVIYTVIDASKSMLETVSALLKSSRVRESRGS